MTEQIYKLSDLRKLLPEHAKTQFKRKRGQTGAYLDIEVVIRPPIELKEHDAIVRSIIDFYGEDLLEVYTEETGHWFHVYLKMSSTQPTIVEL